MKKITIDPVTRVEGHGRVEIFLDEAGEVADACFVVPELRGFEQLCVGRPVEEMPALTARICGLCPEAHHLASAKALDRLFGVEPTPGARVIRETLYAAFMVSAQATHFFALAGPDFLLGEETRADRRTLLTVLRELGPDLARRILDNRVHNHEVVALLGGRRIHPEAVVPGGWSRRVTEQMRDRILEVAEENVAFALDCLQLYRDRVFGRRDHFELLTSSGFTQPTHSMATVDGQGRLSFLGDTLRVVDAAGSEVLRFPAASYTDHITERVEPWSYMKRPRLRAEGTNGPAEGETEGAIAVGPLARLNVCSALSTPRAQDAFRTMYQALGAWEDGGGRRPIHHRLATHWARLVEQLHAAERLVELAKAPELTDPDVRPPVPDKPRVIEAVGSVEAPRGTLVHHYTTDADGIVTGVNLVTATTFNHGAIALSLTGAARSLVRRGADLDDRLLNKIEMAIRAHDPCLACATHTLPGSMPLEAVVRDAAGAVIQVVRRSSVG
jgi:F420-non-reducing hydrogenase large subunit